MKRILKPASEGQQRARRGQACILTSLKHACHRAELVTIEGVELRLCPTHRGRLEAIVYDAKHEDAKHKRLRRAA